VTAVQELRRNTVNLIVVVSDGLLDGIEASVEAAGADCVVSPNQFNRFYALVEYIRAHGSRSRRPLRIHFTDKEIRWQ